MVSTFSFSESANLRPFMSKDLFYDGNYFFNALLNLWVSEIGPTHFTGVSFIHLILKLSVILDLLKFKI